jgi:hypothetical protein
MRYEVEPITWALRVYDEPGLRAHDEDYVASALIRKYGDRGWVSSISSPRLFSVFTDHFEEILDIVGVSCFEGYMSEPMARALRIRLGSARWAEYYVARRGICSGRTMPWVVLSRPDNVEEDKK